jgi:uncharacterized protein YbbK (DUF523 family)
VAKVLISACLTGRACRYDGRDALQPSLVDALRGITEKGDATDAFLDGARQAVACATREGCTIAYLKERSPSCGCAVVHTDDGLTRGCGVAAALLRRAGIATVSVS